MVDYTPKTTSAHHQQPLPKQSRHGAMSLFFASLYGSTKTRNYGNVLSAAINSDSENGKFLMEETVNATSSCALGDPQLIAKASQFSTFPFAGQTT